MAAILSALAATVISPTENRVQLVGNGQNVADIGWDARACDSGGQTDGGRRLRTYPEGTAGFGPPRPAPGKLHSAAARLNAGDVRHAGLGLSRTARIARAHGGHLSVESAVGVGSVFTLSLPLDRAPESALSKRATADRASSA